MKISGVITNDKTTMTPDGWQVIGRDGDVTLWYQPSSGEYKATMGEEAAK